MNSLAGGMNASGLGDISPEDMIAIRLAMRQHKMRKSTVAAGYGGPANAGGSGAAYLPQSLENTLAIATFKRTDCVFWNMVPKVNVHSTVNEFTRVEKHGDVEIDPFFMEGGLPSGAATSLTRAYSRVVYMGAKGAVTFPMLRSRIIGGAANAEAQEVLEKTLFLLGRLEEQSYFGDARINPYAFDGLRSTLEQAAPGNIQDMRGQVLTGRRMRYDMALHRDLNATPTVVIMSNGLRVDLGNMQDGSIRRNIQGNQSAANRLGVRAEGIDADHDYVPFRSTIFLQPKGAPNAAAIQPDPAAAAPSAPAFTSVAAATHSSGQFTEDELGTYYWKATAVGPNGISAPTTTAGVAIDAITKRAVLTLNDANVTGVWYYRFYRSDKNVDGNYKYVFSTARAAAGVATVAYDANADLPGTTWAFSIQMTPDVIEVIRLLDYMKQDLAIVDTTKRFALIMFAALRSRTPTKMWAWKNVGRLPE